MEWLMDLCVGILFQMQTLQGGEDAMLRLDQLEELYYELQLQLYDIQAEVLSCEELLLTAQLQSLRRTMTGEYVWAWVWDSAVCQYFS